MDFLSRLTADVKSAMLAHEADKVGVLRLLNAELKNAKIKKGEELTESEIIQVIQREVKKRQEAIELYQGQGQTERATSEANEVTILKVYLPAAADEATIEAFINQKIAELGKDPSQRGNLIKETLAHFGAQTDGKTVSSLVAKLLG